MYASESPLHSSTVARSLVASTLSESNLVVGAVGEVQLVKEHGITLLVRRWRLCGRRLPSLSLVCRRKVEAALLVNQLVL